MSFDTTTVEHLGRFSPSREEVRSEAYLKRIPGIFSDGTTSIYFDIFENGKDFAEHYVKLNSVASDRTLWPEGAERPSDQAVNWSWVVIQQLVDDAFVPTKVVASAEGGVAVCFVADNKYADIECLNSGEILGVLSNRHDRPTVWEIEPSPSDIARASARIYAFFRGIKT